MQGYRKSNSCKETVFHTTRDQPQEHVVICSIWALGSCWEWIIRDFHLPDYPHLQKHWGNHAGCQCAKEQCELHIGNITPLFWYSRPKAVLQAAHAECTLCDKHTASVTGLGPICLTWPSVYPDHGINSVLCSSVKQNAQ